LPFPGLDFFVIVSTNNILMELAMKSLNDQLSQYAAYHRDPRNIMTHFVGIPMIVLAITTLLARPGIELFGLMLSPAMLLALASVIYYLILDLFFGLVMTLLMAVMVWADAMLAAGSSILWLSAGIGLFVIGWVLQFIGHYYEGKKPAFVDDIMGLVIGPLFVAAEALFILGLCAKTQQEIEKRVGPIKTV
jgi:uncharacterized membrane protein YGL010W